MVDTGGQEPEDDNEDINIPEQVEGCFGGERKGLPSTFLYARCYETSPSWHWQA